MAQFDVHRNLGKSRRHYPYLVVVQNGLLRGWDRRIVIPVANAAMFQGAPDPLLNPTVLVEDLSLYVAPQHITNVPGEALGPVVANLEAYAETIIGALDWVLSRSFR